MSSVASSTQNIQPIKWVKAIAQVAFLSLLWFLANHAAKMFDIPISGGILGLGILVVLLLSGMIKPAWVEGGAELILANMLLYFIPLVVSIVQYADLFESQGLKLIVVIGVGFISVFLSTAFVVEWSCQLIRKRRFKKNIYRRANRALIVGVE
jgi:holin-like protein